MGFEALDANGMAGLSLEDLAADAPLMPAVTMPGFAVNPMTGTQEPTMATRVGWAGGTAKMVALPTIIGGLLGYFLYGMTGALVGAVIAGVGYYFLHYYIVGQALGAAFQAG
jgi:hypothetical protein